MTFKSVLLASCFVSFTSTAFADETGKGKVSKISDKVESGPVSAIDTPVWETIDAESCLENGTHVNYVKHVNNASRRIIFNSGGNMQEYSNAARKNWLASIHTGVGEHTWTVVEHNAQWGDFCGFDGYWVSGTVFHSTYPHPNPVTNEYVSAVSGISGASYNDYVTYFNSNRDADQPAMDFCNFQKCPGWPDKPPTDKPSGENGTGGSLSGKLDKLQIKALKKHKAIIGKPGVIGDDSVPNHTSNIEKKSD